ncbi:MAG: response regulator [Gammaproteobacteria bacterium]
MSRVIFVDDEPRVLNGIKKSLGDEWQVDFCPSAEIALEIMERETGDIVVTDLQMPSMSGHELILDVRHKFSATTAIVLSGQCSELDKKQIRLAGIRFFPKP